MKIGKRAQLGLQIYCLWTWFLILDPILAATLPSSQVQSLLHLQKLFEYPSALSKWNTSTDFCSIPQSRLLNVSCSTDNTLIVLQIVGDKASASVEQKFSANYTEANVRLSDGFSSSALANSLLKFPNLQVLSLVSLGIWGVLPVNLDHLRSLQVLNVSNNLFSGDIPDRYSALGSLQSLALNDNMLTGAFPDFLNVIPNLDTLFLSNNRLSGQIPSQISLFGSLKTLHLEHNQFSGTLPPSLSNVRYLETLSLSQNQLSGVIPSLSGIKTLKVVNLDENAFGPYFPELPNQVTIMTISKNQLAASILESYRNLTNLQVLNLSSNLISGTPPAFIFAIPSLEVLILNNNHLHGTLPANLSLGKNLSVLDISSNYFSGKLPQEFTHNGRKRSIVFDKNCFTTSLQVQQPQSSCQAVSLNDEPRSMSPHDHKKKRGALIAGVVTGAVALAAALVVLVGLVAKCYQQGKTPRCGASSCADSACIEAPPEVASNARYLTQSGSLGAAGSVPHRSFTIQELEDATNKFSHAVLLGEGQHGKVYKGRLEDGTLVAIKCMTIDSKQDMKQLRAHLTLLSKIRHRHIVSLMGHCIDKQKDSRRNKRLFLVSEYIENGTLRKHLTKTDKKDPLNWPDRLNAVLGAGRGIQYLHTGAVPGIFNNDIKITNIFLDQSLVAKVGDFGLGRQAEESYDSAGRLFFQKVSHIDVDHNHRRLATDKKDVYNFGLVLLEIVLGRPPIIENPKAVRPIVKDLEIMMADNTQKWEMIDPAIAGTCFEDSLSTVLEIAAKCLMEDAAARPSMEDVIWNLQYAAQVQGRISAEEYQGDELYESPPRPRTKGSSPSVNRNGFSNIRLR